MNQEFHESRASPGEPVPSRPDFYGLPPPQASDPEQPPVATIAMIGGLVVAALVFVIAGIGFALGWWGPNAAEESVAQAEPTKVESSETGEPEPVAMQGAELMPAPEVRAPAAAIDNADPFAGAEPVPEIAPRSGGRNGGSGASSRGAAGGELGADGKVRPPRVRVAFSRGHYEQVEVKLGGKVFGLVADKTIELPPGGYRVELRKTPESEWKTAGLITIELGSRYRVTLFDPPLAKLEVLK